MRSSLLVACLLAALYGITPARAEDDVNRAVIAVGWYNVTDSEDFQRDHDFRGELRLAEYEFWHAHPWIGFELTYNNIGWFGGGVEWDIDLYDWLVLTLQTGVGYFEDGQIYDAGWRYNPDAGLEFRHQLELAWRFPTGNRIGIAFSHMSNAGIGDQGNPAMESLTFNFHIPLTNLQGARK